MSNPGPETTETARVATYPRLVRSTKLASNLFQIPPEYENVRDRVTCNICGDLQPGQVYMCFQQHILCAHCRMVNCGICSSVTEEGQGIRVTCKSTLILISDHIHDKVFEASTFKCIYAEHGCTQTVLGTHYKLHMASCPFRPGPRGVPRSEKSYVTKVYHVEKRVTVEYAKEHENKPSIFWSPEIQKLREELSKQAETQTSPPNPPNPPN